MEDMDAAPWVLNPISNRCEQPLGTASSEQHAVELSTQGVCANVTKGLNIALLQPQTSQVSPWQPSGPVPGPFAWNKVQNVPLGKMTRDQFITMDGTTIEPEIDSVKDNIAKLDMAIVAKLMGRRISFPFLIKELKRRWFHFGEFEVVTIDPNTFICIFQSHETRDVVLSSGPWIIAGNIIGMDRWDSTCSPNSLHGLRSSIWIRLPQLPLIYWDINNITRIANSLGEPLWMDAHTSKWVRSSFARICVRIDLSQKLLPGVWINGIHGRFFQRVEYEGLSKFCFDCGAIVHLRSSCTSKNQGRGLSETSGNAT
ncbi:uncharacterized protein LOC110106626 [Dendrobium catenatum]|uniref:uncharacterized protein LOC110106626 n=1 Tax=Dendrobium catenatum TaxID=906689 RepID=UPI0009F511FB|nr:uncharacterized protein LOC110106626 [Dendrobium catenatum]